MEHLKLIMEKLELMNEGERLNNEEYVYLMEHIGKAYNKKDIDKFVRVMKISSHINVYWCDTEGESNLNSKRSDWTHKTSEGEAYNDDGEEVKIHLETVEVDLNTENTFHTLKIIEDPDGPREYTSSIDWEKNTIKVGCYEKMKITKYILNQCINETIIYLEDVE